MNAVATRQELIALLPPGTVGAEIGVLCGDFSEQILENPVRKLFLIDAWERQDPKQYVDDANLQDHDGNHRRVCDRFDTEMASGRVVVIKGFSVDVARNWEGGPLDWVYIDANHAFTHVLADLIHWADRVKPDGYLMGHDYVRASWCGVIEAVDYFCNAYGWEIDCLTGEQFASFRLKRKAA